jgi:hypothetical protein
MTMPGSQRISGEAFAIARLAEDPDLDYDALRRLANEAGVTMAPIQYGRARRHLGLPPAKLAKAERAATSQSRKAEPEAAPGHDDASDAEPAAADHEPDQPVAAEPEPVAASATTATDDDRDDPARDMVAPKRKGSAAFDFLVQELRHAPTLAYAELRARAAAKGWNIAPIMYGRAKAVLGLVPVRARGTAKKAAAAASAAATPTAPRVLKQVESVAADRFAKQLEDVRNLEQLVAAVKELDAERRRLRNLLERIVTMIDEALG